MWSAAAAAARRSVTIGGGGVSKMSAEAARRRRRTAPLCAFEILRRWTNYLLIEDAEDENSGKNSPPNEKC